MDRVISGSGPRRNGARRIGAILVLNVLELGINAYVMIRVDGDPRILLLAFLAALVLRYGALWVLLAAHRRHPGLADSRWVRLLTRHPGEGGAYLDDKPTLSIAQHLIFIAVVGAFPYTIVALPLGSGPAPEGIAWMMPILAIRVLHDFLTRRLVYVDFTKSEPVNASYNFGGIFVLMLLFVLLSLLAPLLGFLAIFSGPARFIGAHLQWFVAGAFLLANQVVVLSRESAPEFTRKKEG